MKKRGREMRARLGCGGGWLVGMKSMDPTDERNVSVGAKIYAESEWQKTRCLRKYFEAQLIAAKEKGRRLQRMD
jgi:hypothetical protein